jgi:Holliday junction DNA helicase RuvA
MLLFGFVEREERAAFDALTAVSKVGPKLALSILSSMSPPEISETVSRGDVIKFASVPGLGKKTAERLVLELKGKSLAAFGPEPVLTGGGGGGPYVEARDALAALGYGLEEAEKALNEVPPQDSVEKYIKEALRRIGSRR